MLFRREVIEARRRRLWGDVKLAQPPSLLAWTTVLCLSSAAIVAYIVFGTHVQKETVLGYVAPDGGIVQIAATHGGRLTQVLVQEGDEVRAGDPLLRFSGETSGADTGQVLAAQLSQVSQQIDNANAKSIAEDSQLRMEVLRLNTSRDSQLSLKAILEHRLDQQNQVITISTEQLSKIEGLAEKGYASELQVDQLKQQILSEQSTLSDVQQQLEAAKASISDYNAQLGNMAARFADSRADSRNNLSVLEQKRIELSSSQNFIERAPVDGTISNVQAEVGQTPLINMPLVSIMPSRSKLQGILLVPTRAAGFLKRGNEVRLQIDAYPYQRFGVLGGHVLSMSSSVTEPGTYLAPVTIKEAVYLVRVDLDRDFILAYNQKKSLRPGMSLAADIVIERKPIWRQLFDPLLAAAKRNS